MTARPIRRNAQTPDRNGKIFYTSTTSLSHISKELRLVTERKFPAKRKFLDRFFMELPFELVYTPKELDLNEFPEMRDVKDSPILATAIMEGIDVFLTGDKDFLVLDVETPEILTMKEFLEQY